MEKRSLVGSKYVAILAGVLVLFGLYLTSLYSYLLFHGLAEMFSIFVACGVFVIAWNSRRFVDNYYFLFLGIAFLFVAGLDGLHMLAYKGMGVFPGYDANLPTQLWIAARYVQSLSLLIAPLLIGRKLRIDFVFLAYAVVVSLLLGSIFCWQVFPACYLEGVGLTPFKKVSEYVISLILLGSVGLLLQKRGEFDSGVWRLLVLSIAFNIASELAFTLYIGVYDFPNLVGHLFKIVVFYLIYKAIVETGLVKPYNLLFRNLKQSEEALREAHGVLERRVEERTAELVMANEQLRQEIGQRLQAQEALRESDARLRLMVEQAGAILWTTDGELRFTSSQGAGLAAMNLRPDQLVGRSLFEYFKTEDLEFLPIAAHRRALQGESGTHELTWGGTTYQTHLEPLRDTAGEIVGVSGVSVDITERKGVEEALRQQSKNLATLLEVNQALAATLDLDTVLQNSINGAVGLMQLGSGAIYLLEGETLYLRATTPPLPPEFPEEFSRASLADHPHIREAITTGRPVILPDTATAELTPAEQAVSEIRGLRSLLYVPLLGAGKVIGVFVLGSIGERREFSEAEIDVTRTLSTQAALAVENALLHDQVQRHAAKLEQRVAERTAELNERVTEVEHLNQATTNLLRDLQAANRKLTEAAQELQRLNEELIVARNGAQDADRLKSAFLATMSHELRTPLNSIIGFTGIILQGLVGPLNDEQTKQLGMVRNSARHLLALINDVLDISKIEAGQVEIVSEPFDMPQVIEKTVRTVTPLAEKKGLALVAEVAPEVGQITSDRRRVEQILINLVNNAVKFTENGEVRVECEVDDGWLVTRVVDTGIGMKADDMGKLFEAFQQLDTGLARQREGTGLGLSICKRLVEMLGGEICAESEGPGKGSTFTFTLPVKTGE